MVADLRELGPDRAARRTTRTRSRSRTARASAIEPLISLQWFMRMDELAAPAIDAVHEGRLRITPSAGAASTSTGCENIRPWCISRQLWWGHRLPVWYRGDETYVGDEPPPEGEGWERDPDVLDTWFSIGAVAVRDAGLARRDAGAARLLPDRRARHRARHPLPLGRADGHDGHRVHRRAPVLATSTSTRSSRRPTAAGCRKSLGTGIDPLDEIAEHGADGVRFGLLAMSSTQDVRYSAEKVAQGRQLANKLWNASRLILLGVPSGCPAPAPRPRTVEDRWILSRLQRAIGPTRRAHRGASTSRHAALGLYDFVYGELCDWYLELVKPRLYDGDEDAAATLLHVLARDARARPPGDPVRHRGDLVLHPRATARPARRLALPDRRGRPGRRARPRPRSSGSSAP